MEGRPPFLTERLAYPMLWFALPFVLGIVVGEWWWSKEMSIVWIWGVASFCFCAFYAIRNKGNKQWRHWILLLLGWGCLGLARQYYSANRDRKNWPRHAQTWRIIVNDFPKETAQGIRFVGCVSTGERVNIFIHEHPKEKLHAGDVLWMYGQIKSLHQQGNPGDFDYATYQRRQGITGTLYVRSQAWQRSKEEVSLSLSHRLLRWRQKLSDEYAQHLDGEVLGVIAALTLGEKQRLQQETRELFSTAGVSHVLALSGLHLGIIFALFQLVVLRPCKRRSWRLWGTLLGVVLLWAYAFLVGLPHSLVRACAMFTMGSVTMLLRRDRVSLNNLALVGLIILVFSPEALFDIGFQLSFLSVASILCFVPLAKRYEAVDKRPWLRSIYDSLLVTLSAQIGTLPLVAYAFHTIPLYGLLANLIVVPLVAFIIAVALLFFLIPFAQLWIAQGLDFLLGKLFAILRFIGDLPNSTIEIYPQLVTVICAYGCLYGLLWIVDRPKRHRLMWAVSGIIAVFVVEMLARPKVSPQWMFYALNHSAMVQAVRDAKTSFLWKPATIEAQQDSAYLQRTTWKSLRLAPPQLIREGTSEKDIFYQHPLITYRHSLVALADSTLPYNNNPAPLVVDYVFVLKGFRGGVTKLQQWFRPRMLVLDARLSAAYRERLRLMAEQLHWQVHDLREEGALIVPLP